jgi:hypothetical protein
MRMCRLGLGIAVLLLGCLGCGSNCNKLQNDIQAAANAFTPHSSNMCSSAPDCTTVSTAIYRNGTVCLQSCGEAVTYARAADLGTFLANDPGVTAACNAFLQSGCSVGLPLECPCVGAGTPSGCTLQCVDGGVCQ